MATRMTWLVLAAALAGCSADRTTHETTVQGSWSLGDFELPPGSSLSVENAESHERVAVDVADDGRVHAERTRGDQVESVDAESFDALKRDHPELVAALRAIRIDYRFHSEFTTTIGGD